MADKIKKAVGKRPAAVRFIVSVLVYTAMLALILIFFSGNGEFIYETF